MTISSPRPKWRKVISCSAELASVIEQLSPALQRVFHLHLWLSVPPSAPPMTLCLALSSLPTSDRKGGDSPLDEHILETPTVDSVNLDLKRAGWIRYRPRTSEQLLPVIFAQQLTSLLYPRETSIGSFGHTYHHLGHQQGHQQGQVSSQRLNLILTVDLTKEEGRSALCSALSLSQTSRNTSAKVYCLSTNLIKSPSLHVTLLFWGVNHYFWMWGHSTPSIQISQFWRSHTDRDMATLETELLDKELDLLWSLCPPPLQLMPARVIDTEGSSEEAEVLKRDTDDSLEVTLYWESQSQSKSQVSSAHFNRYDPSTVDMLIIPYQDPLALKADLQDLTVEALHLLNIHLISFRGRKYALLEITSHSERYRLQWSELINSLMKIADTEPLRCIHRRPYIFISLRDRLSPPLNDQELVERALNLTSKPSRE